MNTKRIGKALSGAAITAMLLAGSGLALAQTTGTGTTYTGTGTTIASGTGSTVTGSTSTTRSSSTTPGIPNTGSGGDAATNLTVLGIAVLVIAGGALYLARQRFSAPR